MYYLNEENITKYNLENGGFVIRRIREVTDDEVRLVEQGWVKKENCEVPLSVGDQIICHGHLATVTEVAPTYDGFSVKVYHNFVAENESGERIRYSYGYGTELNYDYVTKFNGEVEVTANPRSGEMQAFLRSVNYAYSASVIDDIADKAFAAKAKLREKFQKSKYWNEDLQAIIVPDFTFKVDPDYEVVKKLAADLVSRSAWTETKDDLFYAIKDIIPGFIYKNGVYLNDMYANRIEKDVEGFKYHPGAKVTRFCRGILDGINVGNDYPDYEKKFALLSDAASPSEKRRTLVISLNLMDFLTMSNGNSWNSCHNIANRGCYHGGTLSYALDETTAILYTLNPDVDTSNRIWDIPKINRQLFMFGDTFVVESRLYPEPSDGVNVAQMALRKVHHDFIQKFYSEIMGKNFIASNCPHSTIQSRVESKGLHYRDYEFERYRCGAMQSDDYEDEKIVIGAESPDIVTGDRNYDHETLTSSSGGINENPLAFEAYDTGCLITDDEYVVEYNDLIYDREDCTWCEYEEIYVPEDEAVYIHGEYYSVDYADEHYTVCSKCGEYESNDEIIEFDGEYYCRECRDSYLSTCDECGEYCYSDDLVCVDDEYICPDCYESKTKTCPKCGETHFKSYFAEGVDLCPDCVDETEEGYTVKLPDTGVVLCRTFTEAKRVLRIAKASSIKWERSGNDADNGHTVDVIKRTLQNPNITGIGIIITENGLRYAPTAENLDIPEGFGDIVKFEDLSRVTVESEG